MGKTDERLYNYFDRDDLIIKEIEALSHEDLAIIWRFGTPKARYFEEPYDGFFRYRLFTHYGGITPELSKQIGWKKQYFY